MPTSTAARHLAFTILRNNARWKGSPLVHSVQQELARKPNLAGSKKFGLKFIGSGAQAQAHQVMRRVGKGFEPTDLVLRTSGGQIDPALKDLDLFYRATGAWYPRSVGIGDNQQLLQLAPGQNIKSFYRQYYPGPMSLSPETSRRFIRGVIGDKGVGNRDAGPSNTHIVPDEAGGFNFFRLDAQPTWRADLTSSPSLDFLMMSDQALGKDSAGFVTDTARRGQEVSRLLFPGNDPRLQSFIRNLEPDDVLARSGLGRFG